MRATPASSVSPCVRLVVSHEAPLAVEEPTWKGYKPGNPQIYPGWVTPEDHLAIEAAAESYRRVASPWIEDGDGGELRREPRVDRWIFSTDGVGMVVEAESAGIEHLDAKKWVRSGRFAHPPMFGIGPGIEHNTHKIGECVDSREFDVAIAVMARFPTLYREFSAARR